jgi:hypothetical protein
VRPEFKRSGSFGDFKAESSRVVRIPLADRRRFRAALQNPLVKAKSRSAHQILPESAPLPAWFPGSVAGRCW